MKTLKSNILEAYKVQVECLKIQSLILMIKIASYSERIQILTLVSEYFNFFEYLVWNSHEIKNVGILAKTAPNKEKLWLLKHIIW